MFQQNIVVVDLYFDQELFHLFHLILLLQLDYLIYQDQLNDLFNREKKTIFFRHRIFDIPRTPAMNANIRLLSARVKHVLERKRSRANAICSF